MAAPCEFAECDLSLGALQALIQGEPPADLFRFVTESGLRQRLWSATDSYFDLGHRLENVDGGQLLHLVSDSQWVMHWSVFLGHGGETAVVASPFPAGFNLDAGEVEFWTEEPVWYAICAASFAEFAWRWWMDNEIFRRVEMDQLPLSDAQRRYVQQYGEPRLLE